jgi:hypothetical protein
MAEPQTQKKQPTYIEEYPNAFDPEFCDHMVQRYEQLVQMGVVRKRSANFQKDTGLQYFYDMSPQFGQYYYDMDLANQFYSTIMSYWQNDYVQKYGILQNVAEHTPKGMSIQRTDSDGGDGYHAWHCEQHSARDGSRLGVYIAYLNDVPDGGETEFLYQGVKVKPEKGKLVLWPAGWTHPHRGNPIYTGQKYIITGWMVYDK